MSELSGSRRGKTGKQMAVGLSLLLSVLGGCADAGPPPLCIDDASCADDHPCTVDTCDPQVGCVSTPEDTACDDGVDCTLDTCDPEAGCVLILREGVCDDQVACTSDVCDPSAGCVFTPQDVPCDDGDLCTSDVCDPTTGCANTPGALQCDDGIECTVDTCDALQGCVAAPDDGACPPSVGCLLSACLPGQGCVSTPDDLQCDDGQPCTQDQCDPEGGCAYTPLSSGDCDDADPCTTGDGCVAGLCRGFVQEGCFYIQDPDLASCDPGVLSSGRKLQAMDDVNTLRALSGLAPVTYHWEGDLETQASSLIMVANSQLSHAPPPSFACWSAEGAEGADTSNLNMQWQWEPSHPEPWFSMVAFLIDNGVPSLGHRRWILDPFLAHVSYGAVHGEPQIPDPPYPFAYAATLQVIHDQKADLSETDLSFVAYPFGEYPKELVVPEWYLSFSFLIDKDERYPNSLVDFEGLLVTVTDPNETPLPVLDVSANTDWFGLPNHIQWRVDGLSVGVEYTVTVEGAVTGETPLSATYTFILL